MTRPGHVEFRERWGESPPLVRRAVIAAVAVVGGWAILAGFGQFGLAAVLVGVVFALYTTNLSFLTGFRTGLIAFTAAVLGGIGNLPGAVLGAMLIGLLEGFSDGLPWHSPGSQWTEAVIFAILILILVLRPEGLLGERTPEGG